MVGDVPPLLPPPTALTEVRDAILQEKFDSAKETITTNPELLHHRDYDGRTILHWAASKGNNDVVEFILGRSEVNAKDDGGWTPLLIAAAAGHSEILHTLLKGGADVSAQVEIGGTTALHHSAGKGHANCVRLLLAQGGRDLLQQEDKNGHTAIARAAMNGHEEVVRMLLGTEEVATWRERHTKNNLLHLAVSSGDVETTAVIYKAVPSLTALPNVIQKCPADEASPAMLLRWKEIKERHVSR